MKFWEFEGRLYASADPGRGKTFTLNTNGYDSPDGWTWEVLDTFAAREAWFGYVGALEARFAVERIKERFS